MFINGTGIIMRISFILVVVFALLVESVDCSQGKKNDPKLVTDWKKDPVCKAVYAGVLKGLYRDQVSDEIVTNIIGKKTKTKDRKALRKRMKRSFVLDCPLREPTFEAFLAYQTRKSDRIPGLTRGGALKLTPGLDAKLQKELLSDDTKTRLKGLAPVVQQWVLVKLESNSELKPAEIQEWKKRVEQRSSQGKSKLVSLMQNTKDYKEWSPYWGCAACNGSREAALNWKTKQ